MLAVASAACVALPPADLAISIAGPSEPMVAGGTVSYTIAITDSGPGDATGLAVIARLSEDVGFVSASGPGWSCSAAGQDVTCLDPALAAAEASQIALVVTAPAAGGPVSSTARVTAVTPDADPSNNTATASAVANAIADLAVALRDSSQPAPGSTALRYSIDVTNLGPSTASDVTVTDRLPAGVTVTAATGDGWACQVSAQVGSPCARGRRCRSARPRRSRSRSTRPATR